MRDRNACMCATLGCGCLKTTGCMCRKEGPCQTLRRAALLANSEDTLGRERVEVQERMRLRVHDLAAMRCFCSLAAAWPGI